MKKQIQRLFSLCIIAALMVSFAFLMPPKAAAADTVITKILGKDRMRGCAAAGLYVFTEQNDIFTALHFFEIRFIQSVI